MGKQTGAYIGTSAGRWGRYPSTGEVKRGAAPRIHAVCIVDGAGVNRTKLKSVFFHSQLSINIFYKKNVNDLKT